MRLRSNGHSAAIALQPPSPSSLTTTTHDALGASRTKIYFGAHYSPLASPYGAAGYSHQLEQRIQQHQEQKEKEQREEERQKAGTTRYVLCDYKAVELLCSEPECRQVKGSETVSGYELYIVEQWACERKLNTCVATFTGNPEHSIVVSIVEVTKDTDKWSPIMTAYFEELTKLHLRPKETEHGLLFVTNLSSFPSNLNLVPIPQGDIRKAWDLFYVNENLRRAGCGGRLVLNIAAPSDACEDKFRQLFRTHDNVPITYAAIELATLVQIGLFYCNLLQPEYVDGLICNETIRGINAWWDKYGQIRHHIKPKEGVMFGPMTVAAIVGFTAGVKVRFGMVIGINKTPKDPFDVAFYLDSIRQFQKHEHLNKTLYIDDESVDRLFSLTDYKSNVNVGTAGEFFGMVKTTVKEVSGKQVLNLADIETLDIGQLSQNAMGNRSRYLWMGKHGPRDASCPSTSALTGIPQFALSPTELTSTSKDLRRAMMKTVSAQKQKTDDAISRGRSKMHRYRQSWASKPEEEWAEDATAEPEPVEPQQLEPLQEVKSRGRMRLRKYMGSRDHSQAGTRYYRGRKRRAESREGSAGLSDGSGKPRSEFSEISDAESNNNEFGDNDDHDDHGAASPADPAAAQHCDLPRLRRHWSHGQEQDQGDARAEAYQLRRTHSFSLVEHVVNRYTMPVYADSRLQEMHYNTVSTGKRLEQELGRLAEADQTVEQELNTATQRLAKDYQQFERLRQELEEVWGHERKSKAAMQDVETLASRLQYEARMLEAKLRDVEEAVDSFQLKVSNVEARMDRLCNDQRANKNDADTMYSLLLAKFRSCASWFTQQHWRR